MGIVAHAVNGGSSTAAAQRRQPPLAPLAQQQPSSSALPPLGQGKPSFAAAALEHPLAAASGSDDYGSRPGTADPGAASAAAAAAAAAKRRTIAELNRPQAPDPELAEMLARERERARASGGGMRAGGALSAFMSAAPLSASLSWGVGSGLQQGF
jgi:hypothetical protein